MKGLGPFSLQDIRHQSGAPPLFEHPLVSTQILATYEQTLVFTHLCQFLDNGGKNWPTFSVGVQVPHHNKKNQVFITKRGYLLCI